MQVALYIGFQLVSINNRPCSKRENMAVIINFSSFSVGFAKDPFLPFAISAWNFLRQESLRERCWFSATSTQLHRLLIGLVPVGIRKSSTLCETKNLKTMPKRFNCTMVCSSETFQSSYHSINLYFKLSGAVGGSKGYTKIHISLYYGFGQNGRLK